MNWLPLVAILPVLAACASGDRDLSLMTAVRPLDPDALRLAAQTRDTGDYRIGALDLLSVTVFRVPELSFDQLRVDASGNLQMPLLGSIQAGGLTPVQLAEEIRSGLASRYLQNPQVIVSVKEAASQKVTVDGAVIEPGVYELRGRTTLLQAIAMAKGPSNVANLRTVAVFRTSEGQRMVALFDLKAIRDGVAVDPEIQGDDVIVIDTSRLNATMRDLASALPALAIFRPY
jgi:polysaccharide export outer membrane protein